LKNKGWVWVFAAAFAADVGVIAGLVPHRPNPIKPNKINDLRVSTPANAALQLQFASV
jgi:hypothetical protein